MLSVNTASTKISPKLIRVWKPGFEARTGYMTPNQQVKMTALTGLSTAGLIGLSGLLYAWADHFQHGELIKNITISPEQMSQLKIILGDAAEKLGLHSGNFQVTKPAYEAANAVHTFRGYLLFPTAGLFTNHIVNGINILTRQLWVKRLFR